MTCSAEDSGKRERHFIQKNKPSGTEKGWNSLKRLDLLRLVSILVLAAGITLMAVSTPVLDHLLSEKVPGAPANFRYGTLGVRRLHGIRYHFDSGAIERLSRIAADGPVRVAARVISAPDIISAGRISANVHVEFYIGDYFQTLHLPVRWLHASDPHTDIANPRGIVVTESLARRLFGSSQDALGKTLAVHNPGTPFTISALIVGILSDMSSFHGIFGQAPVSAWLDFSAYASLRGFKFESPHSVDGVTYRSNFQFDGIPALVTVPDAMTPAQLHVMLDNLWQAAVAQGIFGDGRGFLIYPSFTSSPSADATARQRTQLSLVIAYVVSIVALLNFLFAILIRNARERHRNEMLAVLGQTSQMLIADRLIAAIKTGVALLAISACMMPLAFGFQLRVGGLAPGLDSGHTTWVISLGYVLASLGIVFLLQFLVDVISIRALSSGVFEMFTGVHFTSQIVVVVEYILAGMLVIVAASASTAMVNASRVDLGIFKRDASIITIARKTKVLSSLAVPDSIAGIKREIDANNLALNSIYAAILKTDPSATVGFGPVPRASQSGMLSKVSLIANGRRSRSCAFEAGPGWAAAAGAHLLAGHFFSGTADGNIVISSRSAVTLFGSAAKAIGGGIDLINGTLYKPYTVIGVINPFVIDASMVPCATALTQIYSQAGNFNRNGGDFIVRPTILRAVVPILQDRIDAALAHAGTMLRVKSVKSSDDLRYALLAPYMLQSAIYLIVGLTGALIAISGALAQLMYAVAMRRRNTAISSALGRQPSHIYLGLLREFLMPPVIGLVASVILSALLVSRFKYDINGEYISVLSLSSFTAVAILFLVTMMVLHFPARRAARAEPAESLHEL